MDIERLLTKEKADFIFAKIAKGLEENKIVGSANMIAYVMKQAWFAGFEEGASTHSMDRRDASDR
jgi:hypothetical protein